MTWVQLVQAALIIASLTGAVTFLGLYWKVAQWRASPLGRHMFYFSVMLAVVLALATVNIFIRDYPGRTGVRLACWAFITAMLWQRVWLLLQAFKGGPAGRHRHAAEANERERVRLDAEEEG